MEQDLPPPEPPPSIREDSRPGLAARGLSANVKQEATLEHWIWLYSLVRQPRNRVSAEWYDIVGAGTWGVGNARRRHFSTCPARRKIMCIASVARMSGRKTPTSGKSCRMLPCLRGIL